MRGAPPGRCDRGCGLCYDAAMMPIRIFDTTLRDGELSPDFRPAADQRLAIASALDTAGVDVIELAYTDDADDRLAESKTIAAGIERATVCCLAQLAEDDLRRAREFFDGIARSRLHLYLDAHRIRALESDGGLEVEILAMLAALIGEARERFNEVEFSPQDATRTARPTLAKIIATAIDAGAGIISISDTTGTATPREIEEIFTSLENEVTGLDAVELSLHAHDHRGGALANALAAIGAGVVQIEGTIGGVGPAGGNTDLLAVLRSAATDERLAPRTAHIDVDSLEALAAQPLFRSRRR